MSKYGPGDKNLLLSGLAIGGVPKKRIFKFDFLKYFYISQKLLLKIFIIISQE